MKKLKTTVVTLSLLLLYLGNRASGFLVALDQPTNMFNHEAFEAYSGYDPHLHWTFNPSKLNIPKDWKYRAGYFHRVINPNATNR